MDAMAPALIEEAVATAELCALPSIWVGGWRSASAMLRRTIWDEFVFPYLKDLVWALADAGIKPTLHFDHDWTRDLARLRELPAACCMLNLDGMTDIRAAHEILGGHMALMGDVPADPARRGHARRRQGVRAPPHRATSAGAACSSPRAATSPATPGARTSRRWWMPDWSTAHDEAGGALGDAHCRRAPGGPAAPVAGAAGPRLRGRRRGRRLPRARRDHPRRARPAAAGARPDLSDVRRLPARLQRSDRARGDVRLRPVRRGVVPLPRGLRARHRRGPSSRRAACSRPSTTPSTAGRATAPATTPATSMSRRSTCSPGEYEWLAHDPTGFLLRGYLPRIAPALSPLADLAPLLDLMEGPGVAVCLSQFGTPEMQSALRILLEAGAESMAWLEAVGATFADLACRLGMPAFSGGMTKAPFDVIGDTFRGTRGIIRDRFQRPEQLQSALERLVPLCIEQGVAGGDASGCPLIFIPLHKGADGFLSDEDYRHALLADAQGGDPRPHRRRPGPAAVRGGGLQPASGRHRGPGDPGREGRSGCSTDRHAGGAAGPRGPRLHRRQRARRRSSTSGRRVEVEDYVARLIDAVAGDGGFILSTGTVIDEARPENVAALCAAGLQVRRSVASSRKHAEAVPAPSLRFTGAAPVPKAEIGTCFSSKSGPQYTLLSALREVASCVSRHK